MNPAPPKIRTELVFWSFMPMRSPVLSYFSCGKPKTAELCRRFRGAVLCALRMQPRQKVFHAVSKGDPRLVSKQLSCGRDIGKTVADVPNAVFSGHTSANSHPQTFSHACAPPPHRN